MIDPIQHITELFAGDRAIREASLTGRPGSLRHLPKGWATVTRHPLPGQDEFFEVEDWSGVILADTELLISIEVGGEPMSWQRTDRITVKYGSGDAA